MTTVEVRPDTVRFNAGKWQLIHPAAHRGGALFAVTASWCGYCNQLKSNVPKAQSMNLFDFFWLDGDKTESHKRKATQMGIQGFPTLFYVDRNGYLLPYNGGRSPAQLAQVFHR